MEVGLSRARRDLASLFGRAIRLPLHRHLPSFIVAAGAIPLTGAAIRGYRGTVLTSRGCRANDGERGDTRVVGC